MSVRSIIEAGKEADAPLNRPDQWAALVVLVEQDDRGDPDAVGKHFDRARRYPAWPVADLTRYGPRIALRLPVVMTELARVGVDVVGEAGRDAVDAVTEPIVAIASGPLRVLEWLTQPGTQLRIAKVVIGGGLVVGGLFLAVRPWGVAGKVAAVATPAGRVLKGIRG